MADGVTTEDLVAERVQNQNERTQNGGVRQSSDSVFHEPAQTNGNSPITNDN